MDVTVVIPNWNGERYLANLLRSLPEQTYPIAKIIVVDNGSTDGSAETAEYLGARVIRFKENRGFATAVNTGLGECRTNCVAILNNDLELARDWLSKLVVAMDDPEVHYATGKILNAANNKVIDGTFDAVCRGGTTWRCGHGRVDAPLWNAPRRTSIVPLTASLLRKALFDDVGQLDERFESYLEDVDFGLRCASRGYSGAYVPGAVAHHVGSATLGKWNARTVHNMARNQVFLLAKHYPAVSMWKYGWAIAVAQCLWGFVALRHGAGLAYTRGKIEGLRSWSEVRRAGNAAIPRILSESEAQLLELQRQSGFDWYWRIYFALT